MPSASFNFTKMATPSEKPTIMSDDSASETLKSATPSFNEKAREAEDSVREGSVSPTPNPEPTVSKAAGRVSTDSGLRKVHSTTTKDAQDELTRVMTSGEGIEYPTGAKLTLISLALCLSVFLMALVRTVFSSLAVVCINTHWYRTILLLPPLSPKSQINSTPYLMLDGMAPHIYSRPPRFNSSSENSIPSFPSNMSISSPLAFSSSGV
jgi:hypothetical protein